MEEQNLQSTYYQVSARKYRPKSFDAVVGQYHVVTTLKNAIKQGAIAHAYLFTGTRGVGKTTCARIFAQAINCERSRENDGEPCGTCKTCIAVAEQHQFNVIELDAASNNGVENIREWMSEARVAPAVGKYKIYILDEAHMLSTQAFNAFLKTLEEPPKHVIFILATTEKHKLLPTILSRCQVLDFVTIEPQAIIKSLVDICNKESISFEGEALAVVAEKADGSLRDALSLFDKVVAFSGKKIDMDDIRLTIQLIDDRFFLENIAFCLAMDLSSVLVNLDKIMRDGHAPSTILEGFSRCLRNLLVLKEEKTVLLSDIYPSLKDEYIKTAEKCSLDFLLSALSIVHQALLNIRFADNKRYFTEYTIIQLSQLMQAYQFLKKEVVAVSSVSVKPLRVQLAMPVRELSPFLPKSEKNELAQPSLFIQQPSPLKNTTSSTAAMPFLRTSSPIHEDTDGSATLSLGKENMLNKIRRNAQQTLADRSISISFNEDELTEIKRCFEEHLRTKNVTATLFSKKGLTTVLFQVDNSTNHFIVSMETEIDKLSFDKDIKMELHQFLLKKYGKDIFIDTVFRKQERQDHQQINLSKRDSFFDSLQRHYPHIGEFIKRHEGKIIS